METILSAPSLDELRAQVLRLLCERDQLDPRQTPLQEAVIRRAGRTCGLFFQVQGPRQVRSYAIWAGEENRVLFYDSAGVRFGQIRLSEAPDARRLAA